MCATRNFIQLSEISKPLVLVVLPKTHEALLWTGILAYGLNTFKTYLASLRSPMWPKDLDFFSDPALPIDASSINKLNNNLPGSHKIQVQRWTISLETHEQLLHEWCSFQDGERRVCYTNFLDLWYEQVTRGYGLFFHVSQHNAFRVSWTK